MILQVNFFIENLSDHSKYTLATKFTKVLVIITIYIAEIRIFIGALVERIGGGEERGRDKIWKHA